MPMLEIGSSLLLIVVTGEVGTKSTKNHIQPSIQMSEYFSQHFGREIIVKTK
jgi:hypothetical protein